ncbi:MAG TPA: amidohydrolase family protein, partial [Bacteroidota bacterium]
LRYANELRIPIVVHLGETRKGFETVRKNFRRTIVQLLNEYHFFSLKIQLVHHSLLEGDDADILMTSKVPVIISPQSAILKEVELPPVGDLLARGIPIAFGTDWGGLNPFLNIRAFVAMVRAQNKPIPRASELLAMCTRNPARALGFHDELGAIEAGKKADMTFVDVADTRSGLGLGSDNYANLLNTVLLESSSRDVSDVMINGNFFVRKGTVLTYSEEDLLADGNKLMAKLLDLGGEKNNSGPVERKGGSAPILDFESSPTEEEISESTVEGFKIIPKLNEGAETEKKIVPLRMDPPVPGEPPRTIKKVFGEDDV